MRTVEFVCNNCYQPGQDSPMDGRKIQEHLKDFHGITDPKKCTGKMVAFLDGAKGWYSQVSEWTYPEGVVVTKTVSGGGE